MEDNIDILNTETRVYMENGKLRIYHIDIKGKDVDMKPHPIESRIFVKNGKEVVVFSKKIQREGMMYVEEAREITLAQFRRMFRLRDLKKGKSKK